MLLHGFALLMVAGVAALAPSGYGQGARSGRVGRGANVRRRRTLYCPKPRTYQRPVLNSPARFKVLAAGRRWGKSTTGLVAALLGHGPIDATTGLPKFKGALHGANIWWVVPDYPTSGHSRWRDLKRATRGVRTSKSELEHRIGLPGGGSVTIKTADDPDSLRGDGLDGVVFDEAPLMNEETWTASVRGAIADRHGWALFLSTPRGKANWFYRLWLSGIDAATFADLKLEDDPRLPGWESWQRPSSDNPSMNADELADIRRAPGMTAVLFAQEYLAQFVVAGGTVLKRQWLRYYTVEDGGQTIYIPGDTPRRIPVRGLTRWAVADLAVSTKTSADFTVVGTFVQLATGELLLLDLIRDRMEGPDIVPALIGGWQRHRWARLGIEAVAFQLSIVQGALRRGLPAHPLKAEGDKNARAVFLSSRCEGGMFYLPAEASWRGTVEDEFEAFGSDDAEHDDIVDVCAYAAISVLTDGDMTLQTS